MEITWYGLSCFRLVERGQATVVTDPFNGSVGLPPLKLKADIVTVSHDAAGHNHLTSVTGYRHALTGPGEYEIGGVFITGIATTSKNDAKRNVLYLFDFGTVTIAHLGDINRVPSQSKIEQLGDVNVLLIPVGGGNSLNAAKAAELVSMIEPNIVIPMHYQLPDLSVNLDEVDRFVKEMGLAQIEQETSLRVNVSRLPEETQTVLLQPKS
ncbi:MAG: MBL fold metallo-hydrolase [Anaerolineae bacterium]|nr:MBL fold metallo-hydrolase [Anaerolineae bacterium]MCO5191676.1 MBL fold metallo-hydrolase [Anaerolineae bacterium]MCO5193219.1 MBL fold metallo-hydrolase [Anaerolineae bacterium]MCO5198164.1 MBL fold metallo-hydrolase [Anaerolineae bacterium]MCO5205470.1 MBL fold metallo-hydrolase [Anaerolineae bacterium]